MLDTEKFSRITSALLAHGDLIGLLGKGERQPDGFTLTKYIVSLPPGSLPDPTHPHTLTKTDTDRDRDRQIDRHKNTHADKQTNTHARTRARGGWGGGAGG